MGPPMGGRAHYVFGLSVCPSETFSLMRYLKNASMDFAHIQQHDYHRGKDELIKFWIHHDLIEAKGSLIKCSLLFLSTTFVLTQYLKNTSMDLAQI